ncbi:unnamed protein product [Rhizophagus irregularis]|uniref:Uncharacterized protein n=1 Tax=Rhizophagus irregularis TaxID=588596 RepID=A0A2I1H1R5_9GLOM|nr:hypothetical protein RhiirA4_470714 [Rhizophagus irregularis]CAB4440681.1 unnamed protein product [Rhizophagus irregularis]CAB4440749.1 unnamed protein product [Rhizophagus irregularis]
MISIVLAYVITADAEIVQVIEGKDKKRDQVVWERLRRNDYGKEEYEEDKIDGSLKSSKDNDLEKNLSRDRRSSNFSDTTSMTKTSTLDENPDIIIH